MLVDVSELDEKLDKHLKRQVAKGAADFKCHVEVTGATEIDDLKRVLVDAFEREEAGTLNTVPLRSLTSLDDLETNFR